METLLDAAWAPPANAQTHAGTAVTPDMIFFAAPPAEIGPVLTAASTLSSEPKKRSILSEVGVALFLASFAGLIIWALLSLISVPNGVILVLSLVAATATAAWSFYDGRVFRAECSYVGKYGMARYSLKGSPTATPKTEVMCFEDATHLQTSQTRHYKNGVYSRTSYVYIWRQRNNADFQLKGAYYSESGQPPTLDPFYLAASGESAWTQHLLKFANQDLAEKGYVEFPVGKDPQLVRVGANFLEFITQAGEQQRAAVADMQNVELKSGRFKFKHRDAKWWSGKGKYNFAYSGMPNARLFILCLQQLAGVQFS